MIDIKKTILLTSLSLSALLYADEPSVYGAGNIDSANPYGLTQTERTILENKRTIQMLYNKINEQQRKVDGLSSIIEGQNKEIVQFKEQFRFEAKQNEERLQKEKEESTKSYSLLLELGKIIDEIKNSYVSRDALNNLLAQQQAFNEQALAEQKALIEQKVLIARKAEAERAAAVERERSREKSQEENRVDTNRQNSSLDASTNNAERYREAVQLFYQEDYSTAKDIFKEMLEANYKAAPSNFYLGEISYSTYAYVDAVSYYKQSALLYDSASYMDVLYLHTAISLEKSGDISQAKSLYEYVISTYPDKESASIARNRLSQ